jgi:uncharacterized membrane protein YdjX (TVP38/TMEM64 family)
MPEALLDQLLPALRSPWGAAAFVPLYALWVTLLLPGVWASMLAGALYGTVWGSVLVFVGASLGAEAAFLLGRTWLRTWARQRLAAVPKLLAIEQAVSREGLRLVLLTRLSPAFPFSLLNLAYGLSDVSQRDYSIGLIGIVPGTILFCGLGNWLVMWPASARCSPARQIPPPGPCGSWGCWPPWDQSLSRVGPPEGLLTLAIRVEAAGSSRGCWPPARTRTAAVVLQDRSAPLARPILRVRIRS